nr:MAG TPA: hypothetical protein [Caudoviricetes sp.]
MLLKVKSLKRLFFGVFSISTCGDFNRNSSKNTDFLS